METTLDRALRWVVVEGKQLDGAFWEAERERLLRVVFPQLRGASREGARTALEGLRGLGIGVDWGLVNEGARSWARLHAADLATGMTRTTRVAVTNAINDWLGTGEPITTLRDDLAPMFGAVRAEMVAVTEVTRAYAQGNLITWRESGAVEGLGWMTAADDDVDDICLGNEGDGDIPLGDTFSSGDTAPPAHVRCRCWLRPVLVLER